MPAQQADYDKLDAARWMAALAVVWLHCAAYPLTELTKVGSPDWQWANLYDAATRWCVPVFVMISGALLLNPDKHESFKRFYRRRATRILPATVFWSVFYLLWGAWMHRLNGTQMDATAWLHKATSGEPYYHLWYLYMLIGLYLFTPYLRMLYRWCSKQQRLALLAVLFGLAMLQSLYREAQGGSYGFFLTWFLPYVSYFWAGRLILTGQLRLPRPALILTTSILLTAMGASFLSTDEVLNVYFYDAFSLTVPWMSLAVFQLIMGASRLPRLPALASLTFGIYLVHPIFLDVAKHTSVYQPASGTAWQIPALATLVFAASAGLVYLLRRLPGSGLIT